MVKLRIIGIMTGNSMDAVDLVLTEFDGDKMRDICAYSEPYTVEQKQQIDALRHRVSKDQLTRAQLVNDRRFIDTHWQYVEGVANAVNKMCDKFGLAKNKIDAIGFHGKTLDHYPPSVAKKFGGKPFTTQMGSAQLLANLTGIPVINDFRSALVMNGFEGAPLVGPHNAHVAKSEGDGCYFNAGNTGNLAWIKDGVAQISYDVGPFNEYIDQYILHEKGEAMDVDGAYGKKGKFLPQLMQFAFDLCCDFYELLPPKSGDPSYYHTTELLDYIRQNYTVADFNSVVKTLEFFAAYVAAYGLTKTPEDVEMLPRLVLFGGGWKNPVVLKSFKDLLTKEDTYILPEHSAQFAALRGRLGKKPEIKYSDFGSYMEARLMADLARCFMEQKTWDLPELEGRDLVLGQARFPFTGAVDDFLSAAARGW